MYIQDHIDIYYLSREMPASEKTALESVMEADAERVKLEKLAEELALIEDEESQDYLMEVRSHLTVTFSSDASWLRNLSPDLSVHGSNQQQKLAKSDLVCLPRALSAYRSRM